MKIIGKLTGSKHCMIGNHVNGKILEEEKEEEEFQDLLSDNFAGPGSFRFGHL